MEADYWQTTKKARDREDAKLAHEHAARQGQLDQGIDELYNRKSQLQSAIKDVDTTIEFQKAEKHRLSNEYETKRAVLQSQRQDEDRSQQAWFTRARENTLSEKEYSISRGHSDVPNHGHTLPNPATGWTTISGPSLRRSSRVQEQRDEKRSNPGSLFGSVFHNPIEEDVASTSHGLPLHNSVTPLHADTGFGPSPVLTKAAEDSFPPHDRNGPIEPRQLRRKLPAFPTGVLNESPEDNRRSYHNRKSLPCLRDPVSHMNSPAARSTIMDDQEITRECLVLKDNGSVITHPPMFAGVPLEKINQNHPFWNPEWEPLERTIQTALDKWKEKLENLRQNPNAVRHTMFLANRQVNRGQAVLDFLRDGCFHPLQFACREIMDKFYKTFINYDTVFRLVNIHEELRKFDLGMAPLEWLRQRLYEIAMTQGDKFSLSKTTHDLYHDNKLKVLREKHGFGNIGRPSGYKLADKGSTRGAPKLKPKKEESSRSPDEQGETRRRSRRSIGQVDAEDVLPTSEFLEPDTPHRQKRQRLGADVQAKQDADPAVEESAAILEGLEYEGYSSRDSISNSPMTYLDFRVYQMRTRWFTTPPDVTQYWTWNPEENKLEHRALRELYPAISWGAYRGSLKINCGVEEIKEIRYSSHGQKILVARTDKSLGDIVVFFKRIRTKNRFLVFAQEKGVKLVKSSRDHIEAAWNAIRSELMPNDGSED